jgi:hypothetical protein
MRAGQIRGAALATGAVLAGYMVLARPWTLRWGASDEEAAERVPRRRGGRAAPLPDHPRRRYPGPTKQSLAVGGPARSGSRWAVRWLRGGLTTKLHIICDGRGRNLATRLTPGQDAVLVARPGGWSRAPHPGGPPDRTKASSSRANRLAPRGPPHPPHHPRA